ncbi:KamA family protein [Mariniphaga sediminis]|uniref:KamA family protein n=1 Tax=Mariniphaga sediminis TaxID=1628158 RepID=A0A399D1P7_9BACT|nr:KamA family protein [Mariniphaga sediminis]RIH65915.1 KamA family protein [Mariniphaga sediminis]
MKNIRLDKIAINVHARRILLMILEENPILERILRGSKNETEAMEAIKEWILPKLKKNPAAEAFYLRKDHNHDLYLQLNWEDFAAIRLLDYIKHAGESHPDQNIHGEMAVTNPIKMMWLATNFGIGGAKPDFFLDMLELFRQLNGKLKPEIPGREQVQEWMDRYPSGIEPNIAELRKVNRDRIIGILTEKIDNGEIKSKRYSFEPGLSQEEKIAKMNEWWSESRFHLRFAVRSPDMLNELLDYSLDPDTMDILYDAEEKGIPFFVNPYYLSLLNVQTPGFAVGGDLAIRCYIVYSRALVEEFGQIQAWEKEDKVQPGKPNAAGWILPSHNIHRRYPEVAIFIPDTVGRACGGLCASCQRMYDFQSGRYNFDLQKLKPNESWNQRLPKLLSYFKDDAQLRDILLTGGDALMSSDRSLKNILDEIYKMAVLKKEENKNRPEHEKYAEILRIRIGTRLPVYLPQRITPALAQILADFKKKASKIGVKQFVIQTHFESPMEVTPEAQKAVQLLLNAGWAVANQLVLTAPASRRGHTAKLRKVLNDIGILTYYTFTVKGFKENSANFTPNGRAVQEEMEEKYLGRLPEKEMDEIQELMHDAKNMADNVDKLRKENNLPFLATDRNILNLPGVGKSLTFRTIGITRYGRRILEFDHDRTRNHSPIIDEMGKVIIIESKSITEYLRQLEDMGENRDEYEGVFGYSLGETEPRMPIYEYPGYDFEITDELTHLKLGVEA